MFWNSIASAQSLPVHTRCSVQLKVEHTYTYVAIIKLLSVSEVT